MSTTVRPRPNSGHPAMALVISVNLSGRLSSPGSKPDGSLTDGVSALHSACQTRSLISWWHMKRLALCLHESPCMPLAFLYRKGKNEVCIDLALSED